jgi:type IV secretion system protein VirD4
MQNINKINNKLTIISKLSDIKKSGIQMGHNDNSILMDCSESHTIVIGSTGSGKTQSIVLPQVKSAMVAGESFVLMDTNGELYGMLGSELDKKGYKTYIINYDNPNEGNNWNPLLFAYDLYKDNKQDEAVKIVENIARIIFKGTQEERDPFWSNAAANFFTGLTLYLFDNAKKEEVNFNSIYNLSVELEELEDGVPYATKLMQKINPTSPAAVNLSNTLLAPTETRGGILAVFKQKLRYIVSRQNLSSMLATSDFSVKDVIGEKVALFIVGETIDHTSFLASILLEEIFEAVMVNGKLAKRLNIILDNFAEIKPIHNFHNILSRSRSLNIRYTLIIDSITSLKLTYGHNEAILIANNIANIVYLLSSDEETVNYISHLTGGELSPKDVKTLNIFEAIIFMVREEPFKTVLLPDFKIPWEFSDKPKELPTRKTPEIKIYNLKESK